ncbi:chloride channel protein [Pseudooceanicola sp. GBMRC 2024]|uniref:Chloride channel protein n=2 Tax=Paracoccaceae TaxID=31989 RepID=A0A6L7G7J5_9RHOB|nr:chloride channel protein [Pseudooceanicola albus]
MRRMRAPFVVRALIRRNEIAYTAVAAVLGMLCGLAVVGMREVIHLMEGWIYAAENPSSGAVALDPLRVIAGPLLGGVVVGLSYIIGRRWFRRVSDPIEANAIKGGKLSVPGSLYITLQTILSSGTGGSVGMEAAYTQTGSALSSWLGQRLHLRREDLRQLVAAGAGAGIAAAFDAPLTGAFYAFELVLASYSVAALLPVLAASITATATVRMLGATSGFSLFFAGQISVKAYLAVALLAVVCAGVGIVIMRSVTVIEGLFNRSPIPYWAQPALGGLMVGLLALITPQVLSSGHGAMPGVLGANLTIGALAGLFLLKTAASVISIGTGFRGGLFFASLFLGAILGNIIGILWMVAFGLNLPIVILSVVGMCALATTIIGAPMAMSFLALEMTQSLPLALAVLFSALVSTAIVRQVFGFSFSTWRFHLRGETIRSAADVGWVRDLTVGRMMRKVGTPIPVASTIAEVRRRYPLGATKVMPMADEAGQYGGLCFISELHGEDLDPKERAGTLGRFKACWLRPEQNVHDAMKLFSRQEADTLAVVGEDGTVLGILSEQYCLRRYADETNKRLYPSRS